MTKTIQAITLHPTKNNVARVIRREANYLRPFGQDWPELVLGEEITIHDQSGYAWTCVVQEFTPAKDPADVSAMVEVKGSRTPLPFPAIVDGTITLPNISGHAHTRNWARGDIIEVHGAFYKVSKVTTVDSATRIVYALTPATPAQVASRPGRVRMDSAISAANVIGSCIQTSTGEWLLVETVKSVRYGSAEGETFGHTYYAVGKHVPQKKAEKINDLSPVLLSRALHAAQADRAQTVMPPSATTLLPRTAVTFAATGERVALDGNTILHERCGDPDMADVWIHYVVRIEEPALVARVKRFIAAQK
jgi:hypothetical protein